MRFFASRTWSSLATFLWAILFATLFAPNAIGEDALVHGHVFGQNRQGETIETVAGANIELTLQDGSPATSTTTDADGYFRLEGLSPASYRYKITADGYSEEKAGRGFELVANGTFVMDLFLTKGDGDKHQPGQGRLEVAVEVDGQPLKGASVMVATVDKQTKHAVPPDGADGFQIDLDPGEWFINVVPQPGLPGPPPEKIEITSGGEVTRKFIMETEPADRPIVAALVQVQKDADHPGGNKPTVRFVGVSSTAETASNDPILATVEPISQSSDLRALGINFDELPQDGWEWYLARPPITLGAGSYVAQAELEGFPTDIGTSRSVANGMTTIFDLKLAVPPKPDDNLAQSELVVQGHVFGQNKQGETIELISGAQLEWTGSAGSKRQVTDENGFYVFDDLKPGAHRYKITANGYATEDFGRGFELPTSGLVVIDLFLTKEPDEPKPEKGRLKVSVEVNGRLLEQLSVVVALEQSQTKLTVPSDNAGGYQVALDPGNWLLNVIPPPGLPPLPPETIEITGGGEVVRKFLLETEEVSEQSVVALVAVERPAESGDGVPAVVFGKSTTEERTRTVKIEGQPEGAEETFTVETLVDTIPATVTPLDPNELARFGMSSEDLSVGEWDWFIAHPTKPVPTGVYQAQARLDEYLPAPATSVRKFVMPNSTTIFDLALRPVETPIDPPPPPPANLTIVHGHVYGQNDKGETIELVARASVGLTNPSGQVVAATTSDRSGYYIFRDLDPGSFRYQLSASGYRRENAGRGFDLPSPGVYVVDLFLIKDPKPEDDPKPHESPGGLDGHVFLETAEGTVPIPDAVVELHSRRDGRRLDVPVDRAGYYLTRLPPGLWQASARVPGVQGNSPPIMVDIVPGHRATRDFILALPAKGKLVGTFYEELGDGTRRLMANSPPVRLLNLSNGQTSNVLASESDYVQELDVGDWLASADPPDGFEHVQPVDSSPITIVGGGTARRDFVFRRKPKGELVCLVWLETNEARIPYGGKLILRPVGGGKIDEFPIDGKRTLERSPDDWEVSVLPGDDSVLTPDPQTVTVPANGTETCEFVLRLRPPCVPPPSIAWVAVEQHPNLPNTPPTVHFIRKNNDATGSDNSVRVIGEWMAVQATASRALVDWELEKDWGISDPNSEGRWMLYLAEVQLPAGEYCVEASLEGYKTVQSGIRSVTCHVGTVFAMALPRMLPEVTVIVCDNHDEPVQDMNVNFYFAKPGDDRRSEPVRLKTDISGRTETTILEEGNGNYNALLFAAKERGYQPQGRSVLLLEEKNELKFVVFRDNDLVLTDLNGVVCGEVVEGESTIKKVLPNAEVHLLPAGNIALPNRLEAPVRSDADGNFRFEKVPVGDYRLTTTSEGYNSDQRLVSVELNGSPEKIILKQRNDRLFDPIYCMLKKGWGPTPEAIHYAERYYQEALTADPESWAAHYAMALCQMSRYQLNEEMNSEVIATAKEYMSKAVAKQGGDFVWDRAWEAHIWLRVSSKQYKPAISQMRKLAEDYYAQQKRVPNHASEETAHLMGASFGFLQKESGAAQAEERIRTVLGTGTLHLKHFDSGRGETAGLREKMREDLQKTIDKCKKEWQQQHQNDVDRRTRQIEKVVEEKVLQETQLKSNETTNRLQQEISTVESKMQELQVQYASVNQQFLFIQAQGQAATIELQQCEYRHRPRGGGGSGGFGGGSGGFGGSSGGKHPVEPEPPGIIEGGGGFMLSRPNIAPLPLTKFSIRVFRRSGAMKVIRSLVPEKKVLRQTAPSWRVEGSDRRVGGHCDHLRQRVSELTQQFNTIRQQGQTLEYQFRQLNSYRDTLKKRVRFESKKKFETKKLISRSEYYLVALRERKKTAEGQQQMPECPEVEKKKQELDSFVSYRIYPLQLRRQELMEFVSQGKVMQCD